MTDDRGTGPDGEELDRVVSRRVDHQPDAAPGDQQAYDAADPATEPPSDTGDGGRGGAAERAAREPGHDDEPTRSE